MIERSARESGIPIRVACDAVGFPVSTYYRLAKRQNEVERPKRKRRSHRALTPAEEKRVLDVLNSDRFGDKPPAQIYAALLDENIYLCSVSTMYRILRKHELVKERRNILRHPSYNKPELLAEAPNEVWSWDITKLKGAKKWNYYHLYVILDIFSRYAVGWMVASRESGALAKELIEETCRRQEIDGNMLYIHSDRGTAMTSKSVALLMADLGITKSLGRPQVSNDNPFSESHFKTLKYQPMFPKTFGCIEDARQFCAQFFDWYNNEHYHSGIGFMTPAMVHYGAAGECSKRRQQVLTDIYARFPERFVKGVPKVLAAPAKVWINRPQESPENDTISEITIISNSEVSVS